MTASALNSPAPIAKATATAVPQDQTALTMMAEIKPDEIENLRKLFPAIENAGLDNESVFPFSKLTNVHFARLVILDAAKDLDQQPIPPALLFIADFDGPLDPFLKQLNDMAATSFDRLFGLCVGYPTGAISGSQRIKFIMDHKIKENTVFVNWAGRTVLQVQQEDQLHEKIETFVNQSRTTWADATPRKVREDIQGFVRNDPALAWARSPLPPRGIGWILGRVVEIAVVIIAGLLLLPFILLILPFFLMILRWHERRDIPGNDVPATATLTQLASLEDHVVHNQFSAVGIVKPGWFRRTTLAVILFAVNLGTRYIFNRGSLSGVGTIHFARWVFINDKRRLLFASNYDGSLESYMDDFIDKVAWGLNAVFSNGFGYPRTDWLVLHGAHDEQAFKNFLHMHQVPTQLWYTAYPRLTTLNIIRNAQIRAGLFAMLDDRQIADWLALL